MKNIIGLVLAILALNISFIKAERYRSYNTRNSWGNNRYKWGNNGFGARYTSRYDRRPSYTLSYQDEGDLDFGLPFSAGGLGNNFYWGGYYDDYPYRYSYSVGDND